MYRGSGPKFQSPRQPNRALSVLKRYSLLYLPVSWDSWVRIEACGADLDCGGPCVEQTANDSCILVEILRRKSAYRVEGGGRWREAWSRVAFRFASLSLLFSPSLVFGGSGRLPSLSPGMLTPSNSESHPQVWIGAAGACTWRYPGHIFRSGIDALPLGKLLNGTVLNRYDTDPSSNPTVPSV